MWVCVSVEWRWRDASERDEDDEDEEDDTLSEGRKVSSSPLCVSLAGYVEEMGKMRFKTAQGSIMIFFKWF